MKRPVGRRSTIVALPPLMLASTSSADTMSSAGAAARRRAGRRLRLALLDRLALGHPAVQPAVEHAHLVVAEMAEHPPQPGRDVVGVVDDDQRVVVDAERADLAGEQVRRGHHVHIGGILVGDAIEVDEAGARYMPFQIDVMARLLHLRHEPGAIEHDDAGRLQPGFQPVGGDEKRVHVELSSFCSCARRQARASAYSGRAASSGISAAKWQATECGRPSDLSSGRTSAQSGRA